MTRKERYLAFINHFSAHQPTPETELTYRTPFELLVAVVLSAQCTDKRVNLVTKDLFQVYPTAERMATANFDKLFPFIKSISYPNNKTRHLLGLSKMLVDRYNGMVPETREDLQKLPGVGRKTANVVTSVLFEQPAMAVDTHVFRVSKRIGLVNQNAKTPLAVEKQLMRHIPEPFVHKAHHWLILHGRYTCVARSPKCENCPLANFCRYYSKHVLPDVA